MEPSFAPSSDLDEMTKSAEKANGKDEVDGGSRRRFVVKGHWKPSEDVKLRELVALHGPKNWNMISEQLPGRTGKSCRLRWVNQLDPQISTAVFSREEDETLMAAHMVFGNQWSHIAKFFPGRTDNGIKNHWHVLTARRRKHVAGVSNSCSSGSFHRLSGDSGNGSSGSTITLMGKSTLINEGTSLLCMHTPDSVFNGEETKMSLAVADGGDGGGNGGYCNKAMETYGDYYIANPHFTFTSTTISRPLPFIDFLGIGN